MSPLPSQMVNRWACRTELQPGQGWLYWHILFRDHPEVQGLASIARDKLAGFTGLHFTPLRWLHITTCVPGPAQDLSSSNIEVMSAHAQRLLSEVQPVTVSFGKVLYHPEAIALDVKPRDALDSVRKAVQQATNIATGRSEIRGHQQWTPHVTLTYSTTDQSASPIIAALGRELPSCDATINSICLIRQEGPERLWNWRILEEIPFDMTVER